MQFEMSAFMCQVNVEWVKARLFPVKHLPYRYRYGILHIAKLFQSEVSAWLFLKWVIPVAGQTDYNVLSRYS